MFPLAVSWRLLAFPLLRIQRNRTTFCSCFRHVSAKGNICFRNRKSEFTFAETHENVAEICLLHVSADVFPTIATECVMETVETQETIWKLMPVLCYWLATRYFKIILHLGKENFFFSCFLKRTLIIYYVHGRRRFFLTHLQKTSYDFSPFSQRNTTTVFRQYIIYFSSIRQGCIQYLKTHQYSKSILL